MKVSKFFALALASTLFVACDSQDNQELDSAKDPESKGDAWVALNISTISEGVQLRSLHNPNQDKGTAAESDIKKVLAIFFDNEDPDLAKVTVAITLSSDQMGIPGSSTGVAGDAFKVPKESKTLLLVANPPSGFSPSKGDSYSTVNLARLINDMNLFSATASPITNGFMMTNAKGGLEPSLSNGTTASLTLYSTQLAARKEPLKINIDRVVAKVRVNINEVSGDGNISISDAGWLLNVTNKKYFPVSKRTKTQNELSNGTLTPFDQYSLGSYRIDPNYDGTTLSPQSAAQYFKLASPSLWNASTHAEYCLENTQDEIHNKEAYTTQAVVRAKYMPKEFVYPNSSKETPAAPKDWMFIGGGYYTAETLIKWIEEELKAKYLTSNGLNPNTQSEAEAYTAVLTLSFNKYLNVLLGSNVALPAVVTNSGEVTSLIADFQRILTALPSNSDRAKTVGGFTYYADAYSYYKVMIKHDNVDTDAFINKLGEFGVVRNSVYDVNVTKFNNPGYPSIPEPKTDVDDEDENKWISVQININPWTWYTQDVEL